MKDKIAVTVATDLNHTYECATDIIGREGEGNVSQLRIAIPKALLDRSIYIDFEKPNGEKIRTPRLNVASGVAVYDVPQYILSESGEITIQLVFIKDDGTVWKSSIKHCFIQKSINALDDIPESEKEDFLSEAQRIINQLSGEVADIAKMLSDDEDFVDAVISKLENPTYVNTVDNTPLKFFVGTQAQYDALFASEKEGLFAIITDDTAKDELFQTMENVVERVSDLENSKKWGKPSAPFPQKLLSEGYFLVQGAYESLTKPVYNFGVVYWNGSSSTVCQRCDGYNSGETLALFIGADGTMSVYTYSVGATSGAKDDEIILTTKRLGGGI